MTMTTIPTTTTAIVLPHITDPSGLEVHTVPVGRPAPGQLLVAVEATGVSYAEQSMRKGRYFSQPAFPFTPGYDLVGTVLDSGSAEDRGLVGTRIAAMTKTGGWTGHAIVAARDSIPVPAAVASEEAETVVVNGVTAWQMLHRAARVKRGGTVLLFGANGGVGGILIQLARHHGVRVIGIASERHHESLRATGVEPLDYREADLAARVREIAPDGVDAVFDNLGGKYTDMGWELLRRGGTLVTYSIITDVEGTGGLMLPFVKAIGKAVLRTALPNGKRATFYDLWAGHKRTPERFRAHLEEDLGTVFGLLADGTISANIAARFPLEQAAAALTLAESRTLSGKVILLP
jgi:NADPH:quinone reductase-like Zn-dependent oxidoreductase